VSTERRAAADPRAILRAAEAAAAGKGRRGPATAIRTGQREGPVTSIGDEVPDDVRKAVAFILRSTGQRPQTEAEIRAKLRARELDAATTDAAIAHAKALRALDDHAFAASWVAERGLRRGYGASRLRTELRRRLIPEAILDGALTALEERDDAAAATELARRRLRQLPAALEPEAVARRLTAYLVRRGHPPGLAQRVAITTSGIDRDWD
jgi:regulatory protein